MAAEYPGSAYTPNLQDTSNDAGGDTTDALAGDYNKHDDEIGAISSDLRAAITAAGAANIAAMMAKILGGWTDGKIPIGATHWANSDGTTKWVESAGATTGPVFQRTPENGIGVALADVLMADRDAANRGKKVTSVDLVYNIADAAVVVDVTFQLIEKTYNGNGSAPTIATVATTYDANHDTAAKRKTLGDHTLTLTVTAPTFLASNKTYILRCDVDDTGGGTATFSISGSDLHVTAVPLDGA